MDNNTINLSEFRPIDGVPGYLVAADGRVYSQWGKRLKVPEIMRNGYARVRISINGVNSHELVHRLVAKAFLPNPNNYKEVNHIDHNKLNNNASNLEWCSRSYNVIDAYRHYKHESKVSNGKRIAYLLKQQALRNQQSNINNNESN